MINAIIKADVFQHLKNFVEKSSVDLVLTDPPYGMEFKSNHRKVKHISIANDDNLDWLVDWLEDVKYVCKEDAHIYMFCSQHHIDVFIAASKLVFGSHKNIIIWEKNNTGMGDLEGDYAPKYEMIVYISNGNKKLNGGRDANIIRFNRTANEHHPTEKPIDMFRYLISKSSEKGDLVLDCFGGGGTTALSCIEEQRNFVVFEIEDTHFNTAKKRTTDLIIAPKMFN